MPPSPHLEDKATSWKQLLVPPSPSTDRAVMVTSCHRVWLRVTGFCAGNSHEAELLLTEPFKLTPYVPYFPVCFVTIEMSDSLLLQNRKQHIMV